MSRNQYSCFPISLWGIRWSLFLCPSVSHSSLLSSQHNKVIISHCWPKPDTRGILGAMNKIQENKTKYLRLRLSYQVRSESWEKELRKTWERPERDLRETWPEWRRLRGQTWTGHTNERTEILTPWASGRSQKFASTKSSYRRRIKDIKFCKFQYLLPSLEQCLWM